MAASEMTMDFLRDYEAAKAQGFTKEEFIALWREQMRLKLTLCISRIEAPGIEEASGEGAGTVSPPPETYERTTSRADRTIEQRLRVPEPPGLPTVRELDELLESLHISEARAPLHISEAWAPLHISQARVPLPISETWAPLHISEARAPLHISQARAPLHISQARAPLHISQARARLQISQARAPLHISEARAPLRISQARTPLHISQARAPLHISEAWVPRQLDAQIVELKNEVRNMMNRTDSLMHDFETESRITQRHLAAAKEDIFNALREIHSDITQQDIANESRSLHVTREINLLEEKLTDKLEENEELMRVILENMQTEMTNLFAAEKQEAEMRHWSLLKRQDELIEQQEKLSHDHIVMLQCFTNYSKRLAFKMGRTLKSLSTMRFTRLQDSFLRQTKKLSLSVRQCQLQIASLERQVRRYIVTVEPRALTSAETEQAQTESADHEKQTDLPMPSVSQSPTDNTMDKQPPGEGLSDPLDETPTVWLSLESTDHGKQTDLPMPQVFQSPTDNTMDEQPLGESISDPLDETQTVWRSLESTDHGKQTDLPMPPASQSPTDNTMDEQPPGESLSDPLDETLAVLPSFESADHEKQTELPMPPVSQSPTDNTMDEQPPGENLSDSLDETQTHSSLSSETTIEDPTSYPNQQNNFTWVVPIEDFSQLLEDYVYFTCVLYHPALSCCWRVSLSRTRHLDSKGLIDIHLDMCQVGKERTMPHIFRLSVETVLVNSSDDTDLVIGRERGWFDLSEHKAPAWIEMATVFLNSGDIQMERYLVDNRLVLLFHISLFNVYFTPIHQDPAPAVADDTNTAENVDSQEDEDLDASLLSLQPYLLREARPIAYSPLSAGPFATDHDASHSFHVREWASLVGQHILVVSSPWFIPFLDHYVRAVLAFTHRKTVLVCLDYFHGDCGPRLPQSAVFKCRVRLMDCYDGMQDIMLGESVQLFDVDICGSQNWPDHCLFEINCRLFTAGRHIIMDESVLRFDFFQMQGLK